MSPTLEKKLAQLVDYLDRRHLASGALSATHDAEGLRHILNDAEVSSWLDCKRLEGLGATPFLYKRAY